MAILEAKCIQYRRPVFHRWAVSTLYFMVIVMIKHKSDPFLAQASVMLAIMLVMYALGGDSGNLDHLIAAR